MRNSELRERARAQLGGKLFGDAWLIPLLACLIVSAITAVVAPLTFGIATIILLGPLEIGLAIFFLRVVRKKEKADLADIFKGFTSEIATNIIIGFLVSLFTFLWAMLFFIPGLIKTYSYSMSYYIKQDNPDMCASECIDRSRDLMNGNKWKLFCLDFSFIGWYIIGALCLGIGVLWVIPYHRMARANFYEDIQSEGNYSISDN